MVDIRVKLSVRLCKGEQVFMNGIDKLSLRRQAAHAPHIGVNVRCSSPVIIIALYIQGRLVVFIFPAFKKPENVLHILKPLIIIKVEEPFPLCLLKSCISGPGKVAAPGKGNDMRGILFCKL